LTPASWVLAHIVAIFQVPQWLVSRPRSSLGCFCYCQAGP